MINNGLLGVAKKLLGIVVLASVFAGFFMLQQQNASAAACIAKTYKQGSKGTCVKRMQQIVNASGAAKVTANGTFTSKTTSAVKAFQKKKKLNANGVVDATTWKALCTVKGAVPARIAVGCQVSDAEKVVDLNVMTYNVLGSTAENSKILSWKARKAGVLQTIRASGADIIGLQETHKTDKQVEALSNVDSKRYAVTAIGSSSDTYKNLILYNKKTLTLKKKGTVKLLSAGKCGKNTCKVRHANWAIFKHKASEKEIFFVNTHLPSENAEARATVTRNLVKEINKRKGNRFTIVTGDFNSIGTTAEYPVGIMASAGFADSGALTTNKINAPYDSSNQFTDYEKVRKSGKHIDKIFLSQANSSVSKWSLLLNTITVKGKKWPSSDHWPVQADARFYYGAASPLSQL